MIFPNVVVHIDCEDKHVIKKFYYRYEIWVSII